MKPLERVSASWVIEVRAGFCDVVARDAHRVKFRTLSIDEVSLHVTHHAQRKLGRENAGVLRLVLFQDIRLNRPRHLGQGVSLNAGVDLRADEVDAASAEQSEPVGAIARRFVIAHILRQRLTARPPLRSDLLLRRLELARLTKMPLDLLIDRCVEEEPKHHRRRAVDRHRDRRRGRTQVKPAVEFASSTVQTETPAGADLAVDVGALVRVLAVEGHRVKRSRQALGGTVRRRSENACWCAQVSPHPQTCAPGPHLAV